MNLRTLTLPLPGFGAKPTTANVEVQVLTTGERMKPLSRWAPLTAHHAPNPNSNCQANGLKLQVPSG